MFTQCPNTTKQRQEQGLTLDAPVSTTSCVLCTCDYTQKTSTQHAIHTLHILCVDMAYCSAAQLLQRCLVYSVPQIGAAASAAA